MLVLHLRSLNVTIHALHVTGSDYHDLAESNSIPMLACSLQGLVIIQLFTLTNGA